MGITTCAKSKQVGTELDLSFEGVKTLGGGCPDAFGKKVYRLLRKKILFFIKPSIGANCTRGMRVAMVVAFAGVVICGELHGATTGVRGVFGMDWCGAVGVMAGTPPGTLLWVHFECVLFVNFKIRFCVGLGAFMIGGASVIRVMIGGGRRLPSQRFEWRLNLQSHP